MGNYVGVREARKKAARSSKEVDGIGDSRSMYPSICVCIVEVYLYRGYEKRRSLTGKEYKTRSE